MRKLLWLCALALLALASSPALADDVIINSKDWKDVYSGMQYGYLTQQKPNFLVSEQHSTLILNDIPQENNRVSVFSSEDQPFVVGYETRLRGLGYDAEETISDSLSLELARRLTNITNFIIVDDSYGYNAVAVAPYAIAKRSYVLFADSDNINQVRNFLEERGPEEIIIYGPVDREVRTQLAQFDPSVINNDGDRFANNVEIVKRYKELDDKRQVILTNGEFLEAEIMSGAHPVLFIGAENVPEKIRQYLAESNIEAGVLIGNDLVGTATTVRRQTGISTFVKFARSARQPSGAIAQVEGLDIFRVPTVQLSLAVDSIRYNSITRQLEVRIKNNAEVISYFLGTYTVSSGDQTQTVGDIEPIFIDGDDYKTVVYDLEPIVGDEDIRAEVFITFGESKNALERVLQGEIQVERVDVLDDSAISIDKAVYNKGRERFEITVSNIGEEEVYVDTEVVDLLVLDQRQTYGADEVISIRKGGSKKSYIRVILEDEDIEDNPRVRVRAFYGAQEDLLVKAIEAELELRVKTFNLTTYLPVVIILILIFLIWRRMKKKRRPKL